jgi:predicted site-specific integrase-resolvase
MEPRLVRIGEAARLLGTHPDTLRKWERTGELLPSRKTRGGTRYYDRAELLGLHDASQPTVGYARVSGHRQKADLDRQIAILETYGAAKGWRMEVLSDLGSGINYRKRGLQDLLERILRRRIRRLVLTHKDRLLRFGSELVFTLCELQGIEVVIIHRGEQPSFEAELAQDVLEIITVFSARLYGSRSRTHRRVLDALKDEDTAEVARQLSLLP